MTKGSLPRGKWIERARTRRETILDLWAKNVRSDAIQERAGAPRGTVMRIVKEARERGDPRAVSRVRGAWYRSIRDLTFEAAAEEALALADEILAFFSDAIAPGDDEMQDAAVAFWRRIEGMRMYSPDKMASIAPNEDAEARP